LWRRFSSATHSGICRALLEFCLLAACLSFGAVGEQLLTTLCTFHFIHPTSYKVACSNKVLRDVSCDPSLPSKTLAWCPAHDNARFRFFISLQRTRSPIHRAGSLFGMCGIVSVRYDLDLPLAPNLQLPTNVPPIALNNNWVGSKFNYSDKFTHNASYVGVEV
jgi:hypothetical protein